MASGSAMTLAALGATARRRKTPIITNATPNSGADVGGTTVTLAGSNLTGVTSVFVDGIPVNTFSIASDTSMTFKSPSHSGGTALITVAGLSGASSPLTYTYIAPVPVGGPGGYTSANLIYRDSFGTNGASKTAPGGPANWTSAGQFNSSSSNSYPYGSSGTQWDLFWHTDGLADNITMNTDWLELRPNTVTTNAGWMTSHFALPIATSSLSVYIEVRMATGRGEAGAFDGTKCWPSFWSYEGNGPGNTYGGSELDWMETWQDEQAVATLQDGSAWVNWFVTTQHYSGNHPSIATNPGNIDITTTLNVYGFEWITNSNGGVTINIYFNGTLKNTLATAYPYTNNAPALIMGYGPGATVETNAVQMVDYIRVWKK